MTNIIETVNLPLVPLRGGVVVFPNMIMHLDIGRDKSVNALEAAMVADRRVFLVAQKYPDDDSPGIDDVFEIGTVAEVRQIIKIPDGNVRVLVEGIHRGITLRRKSKFTRTLGRIQCNLRRWFAALFMSLKNGLNFPDASPQKLSLP